MLSPLEHFTTLRKNYQTVLLLPLAQRTITLDSAHTMSDAQVFENSVFKESHQESGVTCFSADRANTTEWYKFSPYHEDAPTRVDYVWGAMMDIMSQGSNVTPTGIERDSMNQVIELTGCAWHRLNTSFLLEMRYLGSMWKKCGEKGYSFQLTVWSLGIRH